MARTKTQEVPQSRIDDAVKFYRECGSTNTVAEQMGVSTPTINRWLRKAKEPRIGNSYYAKNVPPPSDEIELPHFPDEDIPTEELIDLQCRRFETRKASHDAHTWFPVKIKDNKPIGILWFGDPHVDDNGCNWPLLKKHTELCRTVPGLFGANIGDTTNNWSGRLARLYAEQDSSVKTARKFAKWFMLDSGVRWLVWLIGNHDAWGDGAEVLAQMAKQHGTQKIICHDWEARFRLMFPKGSEIKVFAAHNHAGNSMWNPLHGQVKAAKFSAGIDLVIAGDKHNWGVSQWEMPEQGLAPVMVRVRGYKHMDDYARRLGIQEQEEGQGILTIFDPNAKTRAGRIQTFIDVEFGCDILKFMRKR